MVNFWNTNIFNLIKDILFAEELIWNIYNFCKKLSWCLPVNIIMKIRQHNTKTISGFQVEYN